MKTLPTFEAHCRACGRAFSHPGFGDFAYGHSVLCSTSGRHHATVDATSVAARQVALTLDPSDKRTLWQALAEAADPIDGESLTASIHCPHCASSDLSSWGGRVTGHRDVPEATFEAFASASK